MVGETGVMMVLDADAGDLMWRVGSTIREVNDTWAS